MSPSETGLPPEEESPSGGSSATSSFPVSLVAPFSILAAAMVGIGGGYLCGLAVNEFGEIGSLALWGLGFVAGVAGRAIMRAPSRLLGWLLVAGCAVAFVLAEVWWIHWNTKQGAESLSAAFTLLPAFVQDYKVAALLGAIFTLFGAQSAYRQTAVRYRLVQVVEE